MFPLLIAAAAYLWWKSQPATPGATAPAATPSTWVDPETSFTGNTGTPAAHYTAPLIVNPTPIHQQTSAPPSRSGSVFNNPAWNAGTTTQNAGNDPMPDTTPMTAAQNAAQQHAEDIASAAAAAVSAAHGNAQVAQGVPGYVQYMGPGQYRYSATPLPGFEPGIIPTYQSDPGEYVARPPGM